MKTDFFYVNEIVALYAATTFLSYFMIEDYCDNPGSHKKIVVKMA